MKRYSFIGYGGTAALILIAGCVAGPVGAVLTGLSLFGVVDGGAVAPGAPPRLTIDPNRAMSDTLSRQANSSVDPRCKVALENERAKLTAANATLPPGECRQAPVCLPGVDSPMMMVVCAPDDAATAMSVEAVPAASPASDVWSW
jgi:hypothetical protein